MRKTNLLMPLGLRKNLFRLFMLLLAIVASITSVKADTYCRVEIVPVEENGAVGKVYSCVVSSANNKYYYNPYNIGKDALWGDEFSATLTQSGETPNFYIMARPGDRRSMFAGWYWNQACTEPLKSDQEQNNFTRHNVTSTGFNKSLSSYATAEEAEQTDHVIKIYAKFVKITPVFDWSTLAAAPVDGGQYYIYSPVMHRFVKAPVGATANNNPPTTTDNPIEATVFTCGLASEGTKSGCIDDDGQTVANRPYKLCTFAYQDGETTKYASCRGAGYWIETDNPTINQHSRVWSWSALETNTFMLDNGIDNNEFNEALEVLLGGNIVFRQNGSNTRNGGIYWAFISKAQLEGQSQVSSKVQDESITINAAPDATGTAYVQFNVSDGSFAEYFNYTFENAGDGNFAIGEPTLSGNILTVPVTYTAQNVHSGTSTPASTAIVKVTAKNGASSKTAAVSAYVDLKPTFALNVTALDWNRVNEEVVETIYAGMEIAASQRDRLQNKLVKDDAQTTGVAANNATWTATITGTNANQFKFANGTQSVSGAYSDDLLDVIYAPTVGGSHTATLHIVTSYTDATSHSETDTHDITLSGLCSNAAVITFTKEGNDSPTATEIHDFGDVIGANTAQITADLFISSLIANPQVTWSDEDNAFVFNPSSVDLTKANQTLTFEAHQTSVVTTATPRTATLTISGNGGTVNAVLTLSYIAQPRIVPTVTWKWGTISENTTTSVAPIETNSDGAWTLEKAVGEKITYDAEAKTATAAYVHHEPNLSAQFVFHQDQTATYEAVDEEYEAIIGVPQSLDVRINSQNHTTYVTNVDNKAANMYNYEDNGLWLRGATAGFAINGQTKFTFLPIQKNSLDPNWTITEIFHDGTTNVILNKQKLSFTTPYSCSISPNVESLNVYCGSRAWMSQIHYFEYDAIETTVNPVTLVYNTGTSTIGDADIPLTFANKRQVTATLNETAAQYFTISATGKSTGSSIIFDGEDGLGVGLQADKTITVALKYGVSAAAAKAAAASANACQLILEDDYTYNHEVLTLPIMVIEPCTVTYKLPEHGTYSVTYQNDGVKQDVTSEDYVKPITSTNQADFVLTLSAPTPASGYQFQGWRVNGEIISCQSSFTTSIGITGSQVEAAFVPTETQNYKVGDVYFADLNTALGVAGTTVDSKVVTLMCDITLEAGNYNIPAGVTLLIPHKADFFELQETPEIVNAIEVLSAYRTLTLADGVTINCDGNICVSAKIMSAGGGNKSAYTTGECGVINMVKGGHIELNDGAQLYCWGYIKGQDMDQGNNTQGTGTVTANAGSVVWENFELGDWRGGTASLDIYNNNYFDHRKLFPFQSYAIQNIEIPTTFNHGSTLRTYTVIHTSFGNHGAVFAMIGSGECMFKLYDANSVVRTWYDATTDLTCYELNGTAKLDQLTVNVYVSMSSKDFILPVSNSMHIILNDNLDLLNPLMAQAGSIIEIKPTATVNLTSELYLYDVDEWGPYIHNYYFRSFNNLSSHKDRGAEDSKVGLDDAKLIVDGVFNINTGGKIYATAGGANVMGNNGGVINFNAALPTISEDLWYVTVLGQAPYINWDSHPVTAANLCNEDGSYTKSLGFATFYNIHGRWFETEDAVESSDHTYWFRYLDNGNTGEEVGTNAVYSHDKTGLEARMKWFNVTADETPCADWWKDASNRFYNFNMLSEWHQFIATETENVYSGSNNVLYRKAGCNWAEEGYIDENCLYTIGGVKKALVNGEFIPLTSNGYDPAYHATANASQYYICFSGCNWHPATPYAGESKAYTIEPETGVSLHYIWFNNDWMNVLRDEPFFYTEDEQTNVRTYYEYLNGEWEIATPYVSVSDAAETRTFYMIKEAFNVASIKKNATITLLRDLPNVAEVLTYTTQNTTCTLDLNGHLLAGNIANLITVNAPGATFTITDNATPKIGKISNEASKAVYVQKGTLVVANGTIESTSTYAIEGAASTTININGGYFAANTKCVNGTGCSISGGYFNKDAGLATYAAAHKYPFETTDPKYQWEVSDAWTITFKDGTTTLQTLHLKPGETPVYTAAQPTKDGYKFVGWNTSIVPATADATYTAQFEEVAAGSKCVTLNSNGGNEGLQYIYVASGSAVGTLPETTKEGNTFAGWFTDATGGTQVNASTTVSADVTWYAHYTKNSYTLTWDANGGQLSGSHTSGTVLYGASITAPTATFEGHTFLGWNATPATKMPAQDVTYTAQWSIVAKHYLQNMDGTYPATPAATDNVTGGAGEYVTPAVKTYDGFITPATQTVRIGETSEVTYNYERRTYTITLDANGGTCATTSLNVKHGATPTLPVATKNGVNCSGWFTKAIGGDKITSETAILYNIGTLYAQYADLNVTAPLTVSDTREVSDLRITTTGSLTINGSVTTNNFILESNGSTASGQLLPGTGTLTIAGNAYFDLKVNAKNHQWYAVAVPWQVDATNGISVNGRTLSLGSDFDIIYYDGARRAEQGKQKCWKYVENDGDKTLQPGTLYMIGLMSDASSIRFTKKSGEALLTTTTSVTAHSGAAASTDQGWNGVANPALFHAFVNPGVEEGQVYLPDESRYETTPLNTTKFVVGEGAFVQAPADKAITVSANGAFGAPRRANANATNKFDVRIAPVEAAYTDRLFVKATDSKEADEYIVGQDLVKMAVSSKVAQLWVDRYGEQLCVNTQELTNETAYYPLGIRVPKAGEYTISQESMAETGNYTLYLTYNGEVVWNLTNGAYTASLPQGETMGYGLRIIAKTPSVATGVDEALIDAQGNTQKVLIDNKVYIIRGNNVYSADGQLVK